MCQLAKQSCKHRAVEIARYSRTHAYTNVYSMYDYIPHAKAINGNVSWHRATAWNKNTLLPNQQPVCAEYFCGISLKVMPIISNKCTSAGSLHLHLVMSFVTGVGNTNIKYLNRNAVKSLQFLVSQKLKKKNILYILNNMQSFINVHNTSI